MIHDVAASEKTTKNIITMAFILIKYEATYSDPEKLLTVLL